MNRIIKYIILLTIAAVMSAGCCGINKLQEIKIESYRLSSISPNGFTSADAKLLLVVDNPGNDLTISGLECVVNNAGEQFCILSADDFIVLGKQKAECVIPVRITLGQGVGLMTLLSVFQGSEEDFTVDVNAVLKIKGGAKLKISEKEIPLSDLSQMLKNYSKI